MRKKSILLNFVFITLHILLQSFALKFCLWTTFYCSLFRYFFFFFSVIEMIHFPLKQWRSFVLAKSLRFKLFSSFAYKIWIHWRYKLWKPLEIGYETRNICIYIQCLNGKSFWTDRDGNWVMAWLKCVFQPFKMYKKKSFSFEFETMQKLLRAVKIYWLWFANFTIHIHVEWKEFELVEF